MTITIIQKGIHLFNRERIYFFEVETVLHGAIAGVVIAATSKTINAIEGNNFVNLITHWYLGISIGLIIGATYEKFAGIRAKNKQG